jgi:hypothetical protein
VYGGGYEFNGTRYEATIWTLKLMRWPWLEPMIMSPDMKRRLIGSPLSGPRFIGP